MGTWLKRLWHLLIGRNHVDERKAFVRKLLEAKTANELTNLIGLRPIPSRSGRTYYLPKERGQIMSVLVETKYTDTGHANIWRTTIMETVDVRSMDNIRTEPAEVTGSYGEVYDVEFIYPDGFIREIAKGLHTLGEARESASRFISGIRNLNG